MPEMINRLRMQANGLQIEQYLQNAIGRLRLRFEVLADQVLQHLVTFIVATAQNQHPSTDATASRADWCPAVPN